MTRGILIYAFNNATIDYWQQAVWAADRVNRHLDLPVTIVTDSQSQRKRPTNHDTVMIDAESGGNRIYNPSIDTAPDHWYNANRYQSLEISPYDETLVIDSDYVVASDQLLTVFDMPASVTAIRSVYDITNRDSFRDYRTVNARDPGLPHWWATVLFFRKDTTTRYFFDIMRMVRQNYHHYANLYGFRSSPFRNDFAVSIALTALYGHLVRSAPAIPWSMANAGSDVDIQQQDPDIFELRYQCYTKKKPRRLTVQGQDFHFMNKSSLQTLYADPS